MVWDLQCVGSYLADDDDNKKKKKLKKATDIKKYVLRYCLMHNEYGGVYAYGQ